MRSLNFAILKYFTKVNEACVDDVINDLKVINIYIKRLTERSFIL